MRVKSKRQQLSQNSPCLLAERRRRQLIIVWGGRKYSALLLLLLLEKGLVPRVRCVYVRVYFALDNKQRARGGGNGDQ